MKTKILAIILGPTAVGKTELSIRLAQAFSTEIISADSRQFYKEIPIGTAAPPHVLQDKVKHHFIGNLSLTDQYNISKYEADVLQLLDQLFNIHDVVIMTGGSGLYIDAVAKGIDELPETDPELRKRLNDEFKQFGISYLREVLAQLDPVYYNVVDRNNPVRLQRAIEVCITSGKPYSSFLSKEPSERPFKIIKIGITLPRDEIISRIEERVDEMIKSGLIEEARRWKDLRHHNALKTVGYSELFSYFDGDITLEEAILKIKINTRKYAKRQMTWFRKDDSITWFKPREYDRVLEYLKFHCSL